MGMFQVGLLQNAKNNMLKLIPIRIQTSNYFRYSKRQNRHPELVSGSIQKIIIG